MKWLDIAAPVARVAARMAGPLLAGVLAAQLTLAGVPAECAGQVGDVVGKLFDW